MAHRKVRLTLIAAGSIINCALAMPAEAQWVPQRIQGSRVERSVDAMLARFSGIERFADSAFARYLRESPEPSLGIIVVYADSVVFRKGYGLERTNPSRAVDPESTLFNIASVSKLITATAVMQVVAPDDPIARHLAGTRIVDSDAPITVGHLLTHTSGLDGPFMRDVVATPAELVPLGEYLERHPLRSGRPPGREIRYSNHGMALAGHIVERVSGVEFATYVEQHVFAPLGMRSSSFRQPPPSSLGGRVATAGTGPVPNALLPYPSGSMTSTVGDMGRFMSAHLNRNRVEDARILTASQREQMHAQQWTAVRGAPGVAFGFFESDIGGERGLFHTGARAHFSLLYMMPNRRVGVFIVHSMRQGGPFQTLRTDFVRAFISQFIADSAPGVEPTPVTGARERAARVAGVYRPILLATSNVERAVWLGSDTRVSAHGEGRLTVRIPGTATLDVVEHQPGIYRVVAGPDADLVIAFTDTLGTRDTRMSMSGGTQDPVSFDRLAWYQRGLLHLVVLVACFAVFALTFVIGVIGSVRRFVRRQAAEPQTAMARRVWTAAVVASALIVAAPLTTALFALASTGDDAAADGLRRALTVGLVALLAGCIGALVLVPLIAAGWRRESWPTGQRRPLAAFCVATLVFVPLLAYYHLLGVRL